MENQIEFGDNWINKENEKVVSCGDGRLSMLNSNLVNSIPNIKSKRSESFRKTSSLQRHYNSVKHIYAERLL